MRNVCQFSCIALLIIANSVLAEKQPLEPGYFKWLLHLGQNPTDRILSPYPPDIDFLESLAGGEFLPSPGQVYDYGDIWYVSTTTDMMIWTPQYSPTGFFAENRLEGDFTHLYHIYIYSPHAREARLCFKAYWVLNVWNNGELIFGIKGRDRGDELYEDFLLHEGVNSMTFMLAVRDGGSLEFGNFLAIRITDRNDNEYTDLMYSLSSPLPEKSVTVYRDLPADYDPGTNIEVTLLLKAAPEATANELTIIEYIPEGLSVVDAGGGSVIGNSIQWTTDRDNLHTMDIKYSLIIPSNYTETMAFLGYVYHNKSFEEITGDCILHEVKPPNPWGMADTIETIDIDAGDYTKAENVTVGGEFAKDYSGSLEDFGRGLVSGLKPYQTGGWAEYEFSVGNPGEYHIVLDYGELWTMFHHAAEFDIIIDDNVSLKAILFPTTHCYGYPYTCKEVYHPYKDPERKAKWIIGSSNLSSGSHVLRLIFPSMYPEDVELDRFTDGRPVIKKIILTNYPGLTLPCFAEPYHLDSYEHAPARIVHDRDVTLLPDNTVEMTFHSTFHSLSQGNEIYFADGYVHPRPGQEETKFEIVSMKPEVFHLPPVGEQDFVLTVRSNVPVSEDHSELVVVWLQSTPSSPARKPYLFTTAFNYVELPPYKRQEFPWSYSTLFSIVQYCSRFVKLDVTDPAEVFIPDRQDLGFERGRYNRDVPKFFQDQHREGKLPSIEEIFQSPSWDKYSWRSWGQIWSGIMASMYWRDNTVQAESYVKRLSENMVFYPVTRRWDWARPEYMPRFGHTDFFKGMAALAPTVRIAQEQMLNDDEQFKILHNLVLPIFDSWWDELRATAVLTKDVNEGDDDLHISRPFYGSTGCSTNGFYYFHPHYIKVGADLHRMSGFSDQTITLNESVNKFYPKGAIVTSWGFIEDIELECREIMSLIAVAAASRDPAVIDEAIGILGEIYNKQKIFLDDGSFRNEPGSYGGAAKDYPEALLKVQRLLGAEALAVIAPEAMHKIHNSIIFALEFPFSNGMVPHLNGGGCMNQLNRGYHGDVRMLEELFPEDIENINLYKMIVEQEQNRIPGDFIDNHNFVIHGWGYAMLRSENGSWDRGMETLLSSKHLLSDPGDHVSPDSLGIVIYGLGAILTPRYGYSWIGYVPPCLNQLMIDDDWHDNDYYGSFWHFDGRKELPSAVAHTGDGNDCSELDFDMSRWCIQFPEYLFDAYFIEAKDANEHLYDWCFINMGDLEIIEPNVLVWEPDQQFLDGYWPEPSTRGAEERTIASKPSGRIVADWTVSNEPWVPDGNPTLLRETPQHSGRVRLIMADNTPSDMIDAQIGWYSQPNGEQTLANSQDILAIRKIAVSNAFVDTLEPIADDEEAYVKEVVVVAIGNHNQQLAKVVTSEGEDWVYLSGQWGARPDGDQPVPGITTDADILAWRVVNNKVTRFYLAGGSYADTPHGSWNFGSQGNHYTANNDDG